MTTQEAQRTRVCEGNYFTAGDGTQLFYRHWPAARERARGAVILFHRGHEHSGRLQHLVDELDLSDFAVFAWDARGHGRSTLCANPNPSLTTFVQDVDTFIRSVSEEHGIAIEDIAVLGQSVGSVLLATWVHDYAPRIRCMVLAAPAFKVKLYVPFARTFLAMWLRLFGDFQVNSYVKASALTHDPERIATYQSDPLIRRPISAKVLLGLYSTADRIVEDAHAIHAPTQLLISGADWVVHRKPQERFFKNLGSKENEKHIFPGFYHDTLGEKDRHLPVARARAFILKHFTQAPEPICLLDADQHGYTKDEFDSLVRRLPLYSPKGLHFRALKLGMRTIGRLSKGIRTGVQTGFDSGSTLDYVYRNRVSGITFAGRAMDWFFLNAVGWRGIRKRKENLERLLVRSIDMLRAARRPVRVIDIAAGHGRYILSALNARFNRQDRALLRDYSAANVERGRALIRETGMEEIARFEQGDAFGRIEPEHNLAVVSGLYELFPENAPVLGSLQELAGALEPGGYLVYTNQIWHPQLEMIAGSLTSHRKDKPWVMRRRTQAEIDQLVEAAGFRKIEQLTDEWGIFTVSLAQKITPF
jgi:alpha-beta hydrolase superfamily lysophospholipase/SAM-dependent methyltransferase